MNKKYSLMIGFVAIIIVAYLFVVNTSNAPEVVEATDIKERVQDYSEGNSTSESASITSEQLIVTDSDENETTYELPEEEFFVSIAPFEETTHPCAIHSLTGCQGEMVNETFDIYIEDMKGNVIVDDTVESQANGFIDLWVPRDQTYNVKISHGGKTADSTFSTFENDNTCITTIQLTERNEA
ncbi:CueP family metal-binding protein [Oceanobacillus bengalensis]|uniref:Uncharacterized protein n=1 Tax=Oceanobacillus bengalensis TaxID=1435466 RepID=A0A494YZ63_9BACI|nr:CueP family metal-binding protein [Oceanobacillus bengalensis]RKQ15526.1 hypothetical protein D8M05_09655 [Oceanobacillus bengalensis]